MVAVGSSAAQRRGEAMPPPPPLPSRPAGLGKPVPPAGMVPFSDDEFVAEQAAVVPLSGDRGSASVPAVPEPAVAAPASLAPAITKAAAQASNDISGKHPPAAGGSANDGAGSVGGSGGGWLLDLGCVALLGLAGGYARLPELNTPATPVFDEYHVGRFSNWFSGAPSAAHALLTPRPPPLL